MTPRPALIAIAMLGTTVAACRSRATLDASRLAELRREHAALHERLESAVGRDAFANRVFGGPGDVVLALRTSLVNDLVAEIAHQYFDDVELDLAAVRAAADGEVRAKTILGRRKVGEWQVEITIERLRGRLQAGHPRLRFHPERIEVEIPVKVRPAPGTIALGFAWDSSGLANVVCDDFKVGRVLEGRVLRQEHVLAGAMRLSIGDRFLTATPVFEDREVALQVDLTAESWAAVEGELLAQDTFSRCGVLLKPEVVLADLRALAARGIKVRLPDALFRSVRLPAHLERQVRLGDRAIDVSLGNAGLRVSSDLLWSSVEVAAVAADAAAPGERPPALVRMPRSALVFR
jgi:hypothetical protein